MAPDISASSRGKMRVGTHRRIRLQVLRTVADYVGEPVMSDTELRCLAAADSASFLKYGDSEIGPKSDIP
jgi:hypothetical protein